MNKVKRDLLESIGLFEDDTSSSCHSINMEDNNDIQDDQSEPEPKDFTDSQLSDIQSWAQNQAKIIKETNKK